MAAEVKIEKCCDMSFSANVNSLCNTEYYIEDSKACHELIKMDSFDDLGVRFDSKLFFG